jgi:uncharacterized protein (UPF0548 family)
VIQVDGVTLGRWSDVELQERLHHAATADLNYSGRGSTVGHAEAPPRSGDFALSIETAGTLTAAEAALRAWKAHRGIRARIVPDGAPLVVGTTILVVAPFGPVEMAVPNRLIEVIDEPKRFGFVYGSVQGHAEGGEELFLAEVLDGDRLRLSVTVHAAPHSLAARAVGPVVRRLSRAAGARYLRAWSEAISAAEKRRSPPEGGSEEWS